MKVFGGAKEEGYSLIELLVAVAVASIVIAAVFASYTVISRQNDRITADLRLQELGTFVIETFQQHIRNANYDDPTPDAPTVTVGDIVRYVTVEQNFYPLISNSDRLTVIYDIPPNQRVCVRFDLARDPATGLVQLLENVGQWVGSDLDCIFNGQNAEPLATDVVTLQFEELVNAAGRVSLIDVFLLLENASYSDPLLVPIAVRPYEAGGVSWVLRDPNTTNLRRPFSTSIYMRNVVQ